LLDIGTLIGNFFDLFLIALGFLQSLWLLLRWRPSVIFINGGSIGVPVAWAARLLRCPYLIHESDTTSGLANRLIAKRAKRVLIGLPPANLPADGRHFVTGIPLRSSFAAAKAAGQTSAKQKLNLPSERPLVLITGGSQGASSLNQAVAAIAPELVKLATVVHLGGSSHLSQLQTKINLSESDYRLVGFAGEEMAGYLAAADLVVARAGASTLADLAYFAKPVVLVPNPMLVGGHQLTNAEAFASAKAAVILSEQQVHDHPQSLLEAISRLLADSAELRRLSGAIATLARPDATADIAQHILTVGRGG
jgi:UDP-N-acetylglucosamine--N-acetylmuramyl-(pentapeptide) pyrophosphoryl-undecaprenol N-acetylglucosamine transferase